VLLIALVHAPFADGQERNDAGNPNQDLRSRVSDLETEVKELREIVKQLQAANTTVPGRPNALVAAADLAAASGPSATAPEDASSQALSNQAASSQAVSNSAIVSPEDAKNLAFLHGTTINLALAR
jgi:hypothetical protein